MKKKERLDKLVVARGLIPTRAKARGMILAGEVLVNGERVDKAGTMIPVDAQLSLVARLPYVSRGGYKLAGAIASFDIDVKGCICADVGACTGGFTDLLLQHGARRVYAIDVGYGQLDWKLRQDDRVVVMERTNARYLDSLPTTVDFVAIDVSFISLRLILPSVEKWLQPGGNVVALVKPQFEAGREQVGKGGIVKETAVHRAVLQDLANWLTNSSLGARKIIKSPITGTEGNIEFLMWLIAGENNPKIAEIIEQCLAS